MGVAMGLETPVAINCRAKAGGWYVFSTLGLCRHLQHVSGSVGVPEPIRRTGKSLGCQSVKSADICPELLPNGSARKSFIGSCDASRVERWASCFAALISSKTGVVSYLPSAYCRETLKQVKLYRGMVFRVGVYI